MRLPIPSALLAACTLFGCRTPSSTELVGGWEGTSERGYAFVSPAVGFPVNERISWLVRGSGNYLYYDLPTATGETEVRSPGASASLALRYARPKLSATLGSGFEFRDTERRFADGSRLTEDEDGILAQAEVFYQATPLVNLSTIAAYGAANDYLWLRFAAKRRVAVLNATGTRSLHLGAEFTVQGNQDVDSNQIGALLELALGGASLQIRGGILRSTEADGAEDEEVYWGVGFYRSF